MPTPNDPLELEAELRSDRQVAATLSYTLRNVGRAEIFLFNQLYADVDAQGRFVVERDLCTVELAEGRVLIGKKIPAVPPMSFVESRNIPCVTPLAPGDTFKEAVRLRLPLPPWSPYQAVPARGRVVDMAAVLQLGYFVAQPGSRALARVVPTAAGEALRFAPFPIESQLLLESRVLGTLPVRHP